VNKIYRLLISFKTRIHGKYCGSGWSDGKYQNSVISGVNQPEDYLDQACAEHDTVYASEESNLLAADVELAKKALSQNDPIGWLIGLGITGQAVLRSLGIMAKTKGKKTQPPVKKEVKKLEQVVKREEKALARRLPAANLPQMARQKMKVSADKDFNTCVISGTEILATVSTIGTTNVGDLLFSQGICPQNLQSTRLQMFCNIFERWDSHQWTVEFVPQQGTGIAGNILIGFDPDVSDVIQSGPNLVNRAFALKATDLAIWERKRVSFKREAKQPTLFTTDSTDLRLSRAGNFFVVSNSVFGSTPITLGTLVLRYAVKFYKPTLEIDGAVTGTVWGGVGRTNSIANGAPFGLSPGTTNAPGAPFQISFPSTSSFTWPVQPNATYMIDIVWEGSTITSGPASTLYGNCNLAFPIDNTYVSESSVFVSNRINFRTIVKTTNGVTSATLTVGNIAGASFTRCQIFVVKMTSGVTSKPPSTPTIESLSRELESIRGSLKELEQQCVTPSGSNQVDPQKTPTPKKKKIRQVLVETSDEDAPDDFVVTGKDCI